MTHKPNDKKHGAVQQSRTQGFTLVEAAISIVLVSVLLVAALNTLGASKLGQLKTMQRGRGHLLAQGLLSEIMRQSYADPEDVGPIDLTAGSIPAYSLARDSGESGSNRADFDDVDDYHGWTSKPPQYKDGSAIPNLADWERSVTVERLSLADVKQLSVSEKGLKRITVTVMHKAVQVAQLVGLKGAGLLPAPTGPRVLLVVTDEANPTGQELARQTLIESWGSTVSLIAAAAPQADFDTAVADADVVYISEEMKPSDLNTKLRDTTLGVVNEHKDLADEFGIASKIGAPFDQMNLHIVNGTHYITSQFAVSPVALFTENQQITSISNTAIQQAPDLQPLGEWFGDLSLAVLETGAELVNGGTAAGRRVQLPWGRQDFDINLLTEDGKMLMKRAIEWAAGMEQ